MLKDTIIQRIKENVFVFAPVTEGSNLYTDLFFDSLSFIVFLTELEEEYSITFEINEMEECLKVSRLIEIVESKIKERGKKND